MPRILLTNTPTMLRDWYGDEALARLRALGDVALRNAPEPLSASEVVEAARGCDVIVSDRLTPGPAELFRQVDTLAAFIRCAMDVRNIDIEAASAHGVVVTQASPGWINAVVEMIVGHMIGLARRIPEAVAAFKTSRAPERAMGVQLARRTIGIIGYGNLGRRLAEVVHAFGMKIVVYDPYVRVVHPAADLVDLPGLLRAADFVVCVAIHSPETENLMDAAAFRQMKPDAFFINVSRGGLVDEAALEDAITSGRIAGAGLDVGRAPDDLPTSRIARLQNVLATPHIGGLVPEAVTHQALETVEQAAAVLQGRVPPGSLNAANATRLKRFSSVPANR